MCLTHGHQDCEDVAKSHLISPTFSQACEQKNGSGMDGSVDLRHQPLDHQSRIPSARTWISWGSHVGSEQILGRTFCERRIAESLAHWYIRSPGHSYWSYVRQLNAILRASHCTILQRLPKEQSFCSCQDSQHRLSLLVRGAGWRWSCFFTQFQALSGMIHRTSG